MDQSHSSEKSINRTFVTHFEGGVVLQLNESEKDQG